MNNQLVKDKVEEISKSKNISEQEIYSRIIAYLDTSFNFNILPKEESEMVEEIKIKILQTIYSEDRHKLSVNQRTEYHKVFQLDQVEMKLLERAFDELEANGDVLSAMYEISLTEKGIMTVRNL